MSELVISVTSPDAVDPATIHTPAPDGVSVSQLENRVTQQSVVAPSVDYTQISTASPFGDETLNKNAETLKASVNDALTALAASVNVAFGNVSTGMVAQVGDINGRIAALASAVNATVENITSLERRQSSDLADAMNSQTSALMANILRLKDAILSVNDKVVALDDTYTTDAEMAVKVKAINDLIADLSREGVDIVAAIRGMLNELNSLTRTEHKMVTVMAATGVYPFVFVDENFGEFANVNDYTPVVDVIGTTKATAHVTEPTAIGFNVRVLSHGVHMGPQPVDCSVSPVKVAVTVHHARRAPMSFGVSELNTAFVTDGSGTPTSTVTVGGANG